MENIDLSFLHLVREPWGSVYSRLPRADRPGSGRSPNRLRVLLESFLERLRARYMFFEPHLPHDPQMDGAYRNMAPGDFTEWVRSTSGFTSARQIGEAEDGRPLFLLAAE